MRHIITRFVISLKHQMRIGCVTPETELHLRREFSRIGWDRDIILHAAKVDEEIARLETQARVLRTLRAEFFGEPAGPTTGRGVAAGPTISLEPSSPTAKP